ncbi:helix-turn-helix domain-containing protein [Lactiplantibacillus dongliensis]|uniref:Helix-turn-helix domain-containing protein n=1 Tax=Lactiplantibacillus dongliensis TaxID=2559919 RepID=A0ABW1R565_9LACO|nr:XRE family transcriptional regulator [Lactiplantibacillus dongliensis]
MIESFNGKRLKEARYYNSKSITKLAQDLEVSKQMVSKYENNKSKPGSEIFFRMIQVLKFPKDFFLDRDKVDIQNGGTFYRSLLTSTQKQKAPSRMLAEASTIYRDYLEKYVEFPELSKLNKTDDLVNVDLDSSIGEVEQVARWLRVKWNLGEKPISNMVNLLEQHGFLVVILPKRMEKVDAFGSYRDIDDRKHYTILLAPETSFFREQFSAAHELGHWLLHANTWDPQELTNNEYRKMEKQANNFAAAFLLPEHSFRQTVNSYDTLNSIFEKKKYWFVAGSAIVHRMRELGVINDNQYIKYYKQISYRGYRKQEPYDNDFKFKTPTALEMGTKMIVNNKVVNANDIPDNISREYGVRYPNQMLTNLASLPDNYFDHTEGKVVSLSMKPYKFER